MRLFSPGIRRHDPPHAGLCGDEVTIDTRQIAPAFMSPGGRLTPTPGWSQVGQDDKNVLTLIAISRV